MSNAIPGDFASFSYEVSGALDMFGNFAEPRSSLVNLMQFLRQAAGGAGPNVRVGGASTDNSAYVPENQPLPANVTYRITDSDLAAYARSVPAWNGSLTFGVNFREASNPALAVNHVAAALKTFPAQLRLDGVEVGNECDLYYESGIRPPNYSYSEYKSEWQMYASALYDNTSLPRPLIQGLVFCCVDREIDSGTVDFIDSEAAEYSTISLHYYALTGRPNPPHTIADLLSNSSAAGVATEMGTLANASLSNGRKFYIGEGNSISGGGMYNISNTFASALWAMDAMFWAASVNISRWNFHGGAVSAYTPLAYANASDPNCPPDVRPLYYGMWAFAAATANNSRIVRTEVLSTTNPALVTWATQDAHKIWRVSILYKDENATAPASIAIFPQTAFTHCFATLYTLQAPSMAAQSGLSFAGLTFDGSADGTPSGNMTTQTVQLVRGRFDFQVPPISANILEFSSILC